MQSFDRMSFLLKYPGEQRAPGTISLGQSPQSVEDRRPNPDR